MARTRRALAVPSSRGWRLSTASRTFRGRHRLTVILSLRRIRDPSARGDEVRILRLRSQARFAQDDSALGDGVRTFRIHYEATDSAWAWSPIHVARMRASYGQKSGPNAGSRASSPGEQAAACDYRKELVSWAWHGMGDSRCSGPPWLRHGTDCASSSDKR